MWNTANRIVLQMKRTGSRHTYCTCVCMFFSAYHMTGVCLHCVILAVFNLYEEMRQPSQQPGKSMCAQDRTGVMALKCKEHVGLESKRLTRVTMKTLELIQERVNNCCDSDLKVSDPNG